MDYLLSISDYLENNVYSNYTTRLEQIAKTNLQSSQYSNVELRLATKMGYPRIIKYLIKNKANVQAYYNDTLILAISDLDDYADEKLRIIRYLVNSMNLLANINNFVTLEAAVSSGNLEVVPEFFEFQLATQVA